MTFKNVRVKMSVIILIAISVVSPTAVSMAKMQYNSSDKLVSQNDQGRNLSNDFDFSEASASNAEILENDVIFATDSDALLENDVISATNSNALLDYEISGTTLTAYYGQDSIVTIPDGVVTIADEAFMGNNTIVELYIPDSVETVGIQAFAEMSELRIIDFGNGFEADYVDIFLGSLNVEEYMVNHPLSEFYSEDGVLYVSDGELLMAYYPISKMDNGYTIPDGVDFLFLNGNYYLNRINISQSVSRIDFNNMSSDDAEGIMQLEHISVDEKCDYYYVSDDGILKDKQSDSIVFYPASFMMSLDQ